MKRAVGIGAVGLVVALVAWTVLHRAPAAVDGSNRAAAAVESSSAIRLSGAVEATRARTVFVPRLAGQTAPTLVITRLIRAGSHVAAGDPLVEFDPQEQLRTAADKRAELVDLDGQLQKKKSEQAIAQAKDQTTLTEAERNVSRAKLGILGNDLISKVEAEKNTLALEEANARLEQVRKTFALKRTAEAADLRILEIQRERAERALRYAESNSQLMTPALTLSATFSQTSASLEILAKSSLSSAMGTRPFSLELSVWQPRQNFCRNTCGGGLVCGLPTEIETAMPPTISAASAATRI